MCISNDSLGVIPQDYVEKVITRMNNPKIMMDMAREAVAGVKDPERYEKFLTIEEAIRQDKNLPLGIVLTEQAKSRGLPSVIVTSTYHHSDQFEPVSGLTPVYYVDTLLLGRKDWRKGLARLDEERLK